MLQQGSLTLERQICVYIVWSLTTNYRVCPEELSQAPGSRQTHLPCKANSGLCKCPHLLFS